MRVKIIGWQERKANELTIIGVLFFVTFISHILLLSKGPFHYDVVDYLISMRDKAVTFHESSYPLVAFFIIGLGYLKDACMGAISSLTLLLWTTAFFTSLLAVLIYGIFKKLFDRNIGLAYAALVTFYPPFFSVTTFGRIDHVFAIIFVSLSFFYFLKNKRWRCVIFTSLAIATRPENALILIPYCVFIVLRVLQDADLSFRKKTYRIIKECGIISFFALLIVVVVGLSVPEGKWFSRVILRFFGKEGSFDRAVFLGFSCSRFFQRLLECARTMTVLPAICILYGVGKKALEKDFKLLLVFLLPFLIAFLYLANFEGFSTRHFILPFFFLAFFASYAIVVVFQTTRGVVLFTILCVIAMLNSAIPYVYHRHVNALQVDFVKDVERLTPPGSLIIAQDTEVFFRYYGKRKVLQPPTNDSEIEWAKFNAEIINTLRAGKSVYMIATALTYDPYGIFRRYVSDSFLTMNIGTWLNEAWHRVETELYLYREKVFLLIPDVRNKNSIFLSFPLK